MKKLVIELMNHGYSERQADMFISECYNEFMHIIDRLNEIPEGYLESFDTLKRVIIDPEKEKGVEDKYAASDNETVGN